MDCDQTWGTTPTNGALSGLRVVDFGQYIAGPLAATMLADQGASVIRINPPGGPRMQEPANALLHRRRRTIELHLRNPHDLRRARALIASADVVIENFRPGVAERLGIGPVQSRARTPRLVYCSLPGFGATDPRSAQPGWEGVVMAAAGAYEADISWTAIPGAAHFPTASTPSHLPLASVFAAMEGALGIAAALIARDRDGTGQWIETPLFDSLFEAIGNRAFSRERNRPTYTHFGSGFYHCADGGYVVFFGGFFRHLEWLVEIMDQRAWIDEGLVDFARLKTDRSAEAEIRRRLAVVFASRNAREWENLCQSRGLPFGILRSTSQWMVEPHAKLSGTLIDVPDPEFGMVRVPGPAVVLHGLAANTAPVRSSVAIDLSLVGTLDAESEDQTEPCKNAELPQTGGHSRRQLPLAGVKVLDLTRILAAPTTSKLLGQLGADVIKVDQAPEQIQANGPMPFAHDHVNRGKRTIALDLKDAEDLDIFLRLADKADIVVQNWSMGTAERLGIDWASLSARSARLIFVYLNANGREGPWSGDRGYADLATILTGISERATGTNIPPSGAWVALHNPPWSYTDYAGGVLAAFGAVVALYDRLRSDKGRLVETSLLRATAVEQLLEIIAPVGPDGHLKGGPPLSQSAVINTIADAPLQRMYKTFDGTVFVSVPKEISHAVLDTLRIVPDSIANDGDLVSAMSQAIASRPTKDVISKLLKAGAGAHELVSVEKLMEPGGIAEQRGLRLEDESPVYGTVIMPGPVIRFSDTPMRRGDLPGPFGCDRDEILSSLAAR